MTTHSTSHAYDAALAAAIASAADTLPFDNRPGSVDRQCTLELFAAMLCERLALSFPMAADALEALVFSPPTHGNPAAESYNRTASKVC